MNEKLRPSKEEYYLDIAKSVCKRAPCSRRQVGAIIVKNDAIVSTGYNGSARGVVNCLEVGCLKDEVNAPVYGAYDFCIAVHAEENVIINAARHGANVLGGTLFIHAENFKDGSITEARPCDRCKRAIINAGIKEVVMRKKDGSIVKIDVSDWIAEDTENYLKKLNEARKK